MVAPLSPSANTLTLFPEVVTTSLSTSSLLPSPSEEEKTHQRLHKKIPQIPHIFLDLENSCLSSTPDALSPLFFSPHRSLKRSFDSMQELEDYILGRDPSPSSSPSRSPLPSPRSSASLSSSSSSSASASSSPSPLEVILSGDLALELKDGKSWKLRRWVLREDGLGFYSKSGWKTFGRGAPFKHVLHPREITEIFHDEVCFMIAEGCFMIKTKEGKTFCLKAPNREEMLDWIIALARQRNLA